MQAFVTVLREKPKEMGGSPENIAKEIGGLFPQSNSAKSGTVALPPYTLDAEIGKLVEHLRAHLRHPANVVSLQLPKLIRIAVLQ